MESRNIFNATVAAGALLLCFTLTSCSSGQSASAQRLAMEAQVSKAEDAANAAVEAARKAQAAAMRAEAAANAAGGGGEAPAPSYSSGGSSPYSGGSSASSSGGRPVVVPEMGGDLAVTPLPGGRRGGRRRSTED